MKIIIIVLIILSLIVLWLKILIELIIVSREEKFLKNSSPVNSKYRLIIYKRMLRIMIRSNISPGYCFALNYAQKHYKYSFELFPELWDIKNLRTTEGPYWFPCEDLETRIKYLKEVIEKTKRNAA